MSHDGTGCNFKKEVLNPGTKCLLGKITILVVVSKTRNVLPKLCRYVLSEDRLWRLQEGLRNLVYDWNQFLSVLLITR